MVKELRPKRETWLSTESFSPVCEARRKEHSAAIAASVRESVSPSGSAIAATRALATASAAARGASLPASAGAITSSVMRRRSRRPLYRARV